MINGINTYTYTHKHTRRETNSVRHPANIATGGQAAILKTAGSRPRRKGKQTDLSIYADGQTDELMGAVDLLNAVETLIDASRLDAGVILSSINLPEIATEHTRCSAIAERPRCRVRYSFRQK